MEQASKKKISIQTSVTKLLADLYTPVGIYLRLRDRFRDTVLMESTDAHAAENSYSFICINAIGGIEVRDEQTIESKLPGRNAERKKLASSDDLKDVLWGYMQQFEVTSTDPAAAQFAQGLFGYFTFDVVPLIESITFNKGKGASHDGEARLPIARYRLYQYVIAINHHKDELLLLENCLPGIESEGAVVLSLINSKDVPQYPFRSASAETSDLTDAAYIEMVKAGIAGCLRGDVFQIVLSRRFQQEFTGDEFNVYRALRHINPSPYLFYFDYGDYKLMGSSPEAQLVIKGKKAVVHPIAGTFRRTGEDAADADSARALLEDKWDPLESTCRHASLSIL